MPYFKTSHAILDILDDIWHIWYFQVRSSWLFSPSSIHFVNFFVTYIDLLYIDCFSLFLFISWYCTRYANFYSEYWKTNLYRLQKNEILHFGGLIDTVLLYTKKIRGPSRGHVSFIFSRYLILKLTYNFKSVSDCCFEYWSD